MPKASAKRAIFRKHGDGNVQLAEVLPVSSGKTELFPMGFFRS
jgi:hypothetical protein